MGQKVNPNGVRIGIIKEWRAKWFSPTNREWSIWLVQDKKIRNYLQKFDKKYLIAYVEIERTKNEIIIIIKTAKPGIVLGQDGNNVKLLEKEIKKIINDKNLNVTLKVEDVKNPDLSANIVANEIAMALESRTSFRIAQKRAIKKVMASGAKGIKTQVSGRLNGVDMARTEGYLEGVVPLQTFRNDIDYAKVNANTTYGIIGVKVWISRGEVLKGQTAKEPEAAKRPFNQRYNNNRRNDNNGNFRQNNRSFNSSTQSSNSAPAANANNSVKEGN